MNSNQLHLLVLSASDEVRQIVDGVHPETSWRVDVVSEPSAFFSALDHATNAALIDEAAAGGYVSLIKRARRTAPDIDASVIGGPKSEDVLRAERRDGVDVYHARPIEPGLLESALRHRMDYVALKARGGIVGRSPALVEVLESILQVGPTEVPILIEGESGTGKDVIAEAIHATSLRRGGPFEAINCAALAEGVLESELFGHERGAFTGAVGRRAGLFERANGGTVFLDEVGEMSANMQVKLLRVLEAGEVLRVGGAERLSVDVRVVAATNRSLREAVAAGSFRQDLYYRLKGIYLYLPPLRERPEDIPLLVHHFIATSNRQHKKSVRGVEPAAMQRLREHGWPGNIRELRNTIDTLVVLATGARITQSQVESQLADTEHTETADARLLPVALNRTKEEAEREMIYASILALHRDVREILELLRAPGPLPFDGLREVRPDDVAGADDPVNLAQMERAAIQEALGRSGGNRRKAAEALGISERTLYRKIKEYGLV